MSESQAEDTRLCTNCKRDIPATNFTIHEIHCQRNIDLCGYCHEPFPKSEMEEHFEMEHALVDCKCSMKVEKNLLEKHMSTECPLRLIKCQYCELELAFNKSEEHDDYCGSRTEPCTTCGRNVMIKDLNAHPITCGQEERNNNQVRPRPDYHFEDNLGTWFENQPYRSLLRTEENYIRSWPRLSRPLETKFHGNRETGIFMRRNVLPRVRDPNQASMVRTERTRMADPAGPDHMDANSNLDYLLALSLQNEHGGGGEGDWPHWEDLQPDCVYPTQLQDVKGWFESHSASHVFPPTANVQEEKTNDATMLPCEFCEDLFPEEELILHQTGCNPLSALVSFSKTATPSPPISLPRRSDIFSNHQTVEPECFPQDYPVPPCGQIVNLGDGDVMIPCEFCGIPLEEDVLYHHQDQCDLRPLTARSTDQNPNQALLAPKAEKRELPEVPIRRSRHQGDVGLSYLSRMDDIQPRSVIRPFRVKAGTSPAAFRPPMGALKSLTEDSFLPATRIAKIPNREASELRRRARKPLEPSVGSTHPIGDLFPDGYKPSFPHVYPARSSARTDGSRITRNVLPSASRNTLSSTSRNRIPGIKPGLPKPRPENDGKEEE
uniref:TRAF-type zinc finger domain-containing protein 1 n=1 Tax=Callorhinchus milii TaxID=7868 RepID=V9KL50_CALMI